MATRIKSGDEVIVIGGKDRGKRGKVLRVEPAKDRVYVEGLNIVKRHQRPRQVSGTQRAQEVGSLAVRMPDLAERSPAHRERDHSDGNVDEEHPAPARLHEQAAERWSRGRANASDRGPDADRDMPALGRKRRQQQTE